MTLSLLDSLEIPTETISPDGQRKISHDTSTHILNLANHLQSILGEAMDKATAMFPHRAALAPSRNTLPRQIWPSSVQNDAANSRWRAKAI